MYKKLLPFLFVILFVVTGCTAKRPSPNTVHNLTAVTVNTGLTVYGTKNKPAAITTATTIKDVTETDVLPYLKGGTTVASNTINVILKQKFANVPPAVKSYITLAAVVLDEALPAPGADTYLTPEQLEYLIAFVGGLDEGSVAYLNGTETQPKLSAVVGPKKVKGKWLNFSE